MFVGNVPFIWPNYSSFHAHVYQYWTPFIYFFFLSQYWTPFIFLFPFWTPFQFIYGFLSNKKFAFWARISKEIVFFGKIPRIKASSAYKQINGIGGSIHLIPFLFANWIEYFHSSSSINISIVARLFLMNNFWASYAFASNTFSSTRK